MTVPAYHDEHDLAMSKAASASYEQSAKSGFHQTDTFEAAVQSALQPMIINTDSDVEHRMIKAVAEELTEALGPTWDEMQHTKRMLLIVGEVIEAFEELRHGHAMTETYSTKYRYTGSEPFVRDQDDAAVNLAVGAEVSKENRDVMVELWPELDGLFESAGKPEGVPIELADVQIRLWDLAATAGIDLGKATREKHAFNATREFKHGRQF